MVHDRQCLPLRVEAGEHRLRVHAGLDDFDSHGPFERLALLGHVNGAHAADADLLNQFVFATDQRAEGYPHVGRRLRPPKHRSGCFALRLVIGGEQLVDPGPERDIAATVLV